MLQRIAHYCWNSNI